MEPEHKCVSCVSFHLIERIQYVSDIESLYMDGLEYTLEKIKRFVKDLVYQVHIFTGRNKLISYVFSLAERTFFLHCCLKKYNFKHHQKCFIFIKAWLSYLEHILEPSKQGHWKRFRLSKPFTDKTSVVFELLLSCKKLLQGLWHETFTSGFFHE